MTDALNREKLLAALAAREELKRRERKRKPAYVPNAGQLPVHMCESKEVYNLSANSAGKTTLLVNEFMWAALGYNPIKQRYTKVPCKITIVVDNTKKIDERIIPEARKWFEVKDEWLKKLGKPHTSQMVFDNGSVVDFYSIEADPTSFEGTENNFVGVDEPIPKPLMTALRRSLRIKGSKPRLLFCGTVVSQPWLRKDIWDQFSKGLLTDVTCFRTDAEVNRSNLADGFLEQFAQGMSEAEKEVRLRGGFFDSEQLALSHLWNRRRHLIASQDFRYDSRSPCVVAIDCHSRKNHTAILITATKQSVIAVKELSLRATASEFAKVLKEWMNGFTVIDVVCDSLGSMEGTAFEGFDTFIQGLNKAGVKCRATRFIEKDHEALIDRIRNGLFIPEGTDNFGKPLEPQLRFLDTMKGLINDIESATWQKNRITGEIKPKLDTSTLDFLAPWGYALATNLFFNKIEASKPVYTKREYYGVGTSAKAAPKADKPAPKKTADTRSWFKD